MPNRSYNDDLVSITGRVDKVLNDVVPPARYARWADEFVKEVVPLEGCGMPLEIQEIIEKQSRPAQRARSELAKQWIGAVNTVSVQAFMKGESYAKASDPRNISTVGAEHTLQLSAYTYSFKYDHLKDKVWYAPCQGLDVVAARICLLAEAYDRLSETDFSRFDGTISRWLREHIERAAYLRG